MIRIQNFILTPDERYQISKTELSEGVHALKKHIANYFKISFDCIESIRIVKESVDARKQVQFVVTLDLLLNSKKLESILIKKHGNIVQTNEVFPSSPLKNRNNTEHPVIVGMGPAGLFAALNMIDMGIIPTVIERGAPIEERAIDVQTFIHQKVLNLNSNIQFGEGGAGTFSDAKLSTGVKSESIRYILETFVRFGAPENILYKAMPHIGTDIIRKVIINIRYYLQEQGVNIRFHTKLEDVTIKDNKLVEIVVFCSATKQIYTIPSTKLLLCIGHSARDSVEMLYRKGVEMQAKPFAIGVRIEHLQSDVNRSRYHQFAHHPAMPQASYNLNAKTPDGRGIYTFCMCPGGEVVMASSESNGIVVNGMSYYARAEQNANSALLVGVYPSDFENEDPLAGFRFQRHIESLAYHKTGEQYICPVQTVGNLLLKAENTLQRIIPSCKHGYVLSDLTEILPAYIIQNIQYGLPILANKMKCFGDADAILSGVETRSSSPVRIFRNENGETNIQGIYGSGEGTGFAGGIMSSAIDAIKISNKMFEETI